MKSLTLAVAAFLFPLLAMAAPPNIILMMGDDHGWEETGYNGHPHVKTPVLDEMAATGLKFERFYAAHSSCSPTRASFLTGRHPNRVGTFAPGWSLRPEETTIAHLLAKAGYHCMHLGKWHVGAVKAGSPVNPGAMGFHEWLSHDNFFEMDPSFSRNGGPPEVFKGESSEILIREAIAGIGRARAANKPVFQVIWFGSPHEPYSGLPQDLALYDDLPAKYLKRVGLTSNETGGSTRRPQGEVLRERYAEITAMDRAIGMLRKHLTEGGLRENTLLLYCGDNGTSPESALGFPHRGAKGEIHEGGTLVPGVMEWPARISKPRATGFRASTSDLLPTLAAISDQPLPDLPLDGIDLMPVIDGKLDARPSPIAFWEFETRRLMASKPKPYIDPALQEGTTPLVKLSGGKATRDFLNFHYPAINPADHIGPRAIIDGDHKLVIREKKGETIIELFHLKSDPAEKSNLIDQQPELARRLQTDLFKWQDSVLKSLTGADYHKGKLISSSALSFLACDSYLPGILSDGAATLRNTVRKRIFMASAELYPAESHFLFDPEGCRSQIADMQNSLERKSLPVRLADVIEGEIRAGNWGGSLAGHRTLMERYSVSAKTSLAAIELLEARGLISCAEQGKKRRVLVTPDDTSRSLTDLLIVTSIGAQSGEDIQQIQAYRRAWEEAGGRVQNIKFDFPRYRKPEALLREAVANHNADALLLYVPPLAWVAAAAKLRPAFLAGGEWQTDDTTAVGYNVQNEVTLQAAKLRELGHQRIVVPLDLVGSKMEKAVREGLATGLGLPPNAPELRDCCPVFSEKVPEAWQQYWRKTFASLRPTAIILTDDIHYLSLCGYCFRNGIRIPKDLSVICLESTEHLEWCDPVPTRMRYPIDAAVRHFRKWIRSGCRPVGKKTLPLETIEAGTVTRAPR